jgi:3-hydroxybutyryl-CoA dehydrogenase
MSVFIPKDVKTRPITIIGGGTLGRRIALMMSTQGGEVRLFDSNRRSREEAIKFVADTLPTVLPSVPNGSPAKLIASDALSEAVKDAWLVFEVIPERLELKKDIFGQLDSICPSNVILASNSSSYPSSQFIDKVVHPERVLSTHFYMPPDIRVVELMSCGKTDPAIIDFLMDDFKRFGLSPFRVLRESVGFIFNRIWAAIKRESLWVVAEGVSTPEDVDRIYQLFTGSDAGPFREMDMVGLDVVLDIENHYAGIRPGIPEAPRTLLKSYLEKGWAGRKTGRGFYDDYKKEDGSGQGHGAKGTISSHV